jgi:hypothetical protein
MRTSLLLRLAGLALAGVFTTASTAFADDAPRTVTAIRIDPHGRSSGVILSDGMEIVGMSPFAGGLASSVRVGDPVSIALGAGDTVQLIDRRTLVVCDVGPREMVALEPLIGPPVGGGPPDVTVDTGANAGEKPGAVTRIDDARTLTRIASDGHVTMITHAPDGAPSGFLMEDGTQVHVIPRASDLLRSMPVGAFVHVDGVGTRTRNGTGVWALAVTRPDGFVWLDVLRSVERAPELGL